MPKKRKNADGCKFLKSCCSSARHSLKPFKPESPPGIASDYIQLLEYILKNYPNEKIVLFCRASSKTNQKNTLPVQVADLKNNIQKMGGIIVDEYQFVDSGKLSFEHIKRHWKKAAKLARKHGAILVAESTDRFIRSNEFTHQNKNAPISVPEFEELAAATIGVRLATYLPPDEKMEIVCRHQAERKKRLGTQKKSGRHRKQRTTQETKSDIPILKECLKKGDSLRKIEQHHGIPRSTAWRKIKQINQILADEKRATKDGKNTQKKGVPLSVQARDISPWNQSITSCITAFPAETPMRELEQQPMVRYPYQYQHYKENLRLHRQAVFMAWCATLPNVLKPDTENVA